MNDTDLKNLSIDFAAAVLSAAARKIDLSQPDIETLRAVMIREFLDIIGPMLP